jgi:hypothetical protein
MRAVRLIILCVLVWGETVGGARAADDPVSSLRHARSLRCTYTASTLTAYMPDGRRITNEPTQMVAVYDNINIERGTARVIYEKGVAGGAGDLVVRWAANALWFVETAPAGNVIVTTIVAQYAQGTTDFIALDSRYSTDVFISGSMSSGTCKPLT